MEIVSPVAAAVQERRALAPRLAVLASQQIGLMDNSKVNATPFLDRLAVHLQERGAVIRRLAKQTASRPAPPEVMAQLASCAAVVNAFGD